MYNYIDLFHGIGGFAYGAWLAGIKFENHFCSDIESYTQKLYKLRFPDSIQLGDITKIDTRELKNKYGNKWIITGGFPCQDISIAGKGSGITGSRSGLWFEYWRIIRDLRPRFAIIENVPAITFRGLDIVLGSLAEIFYNVEGQSISAKEIGANHKREREWLVAYPDDERLLYRQNEIESAKGGKPSQRDVSAKSQDVADTCCARLQESACTKFGSIQSQVEESQGREFSRGNAKAWGNWSTEPDVGRLAHGIPNRVDRLKGLGNAIVPQIAELLFRRIKEIINV